ncbi:unnamed protein product, partial [Brassica rapa subsp. trilocularis]
WWVNNPTLGEFCFTMIGRADIEGSKSKVAMNAWLPQASYPCGNFSDTSSFKFRRSKGSIGHAFTMCRPSQTAHLTMSSARIDPPKRFLGLKEGVVTPPPIHGLKQPANSRRVRNWDPRAQPSEPILFPKLRIHFADFPCLHCSIDQRLFILET